jgi:PAS domain-containing protein
LDQTSDSGRGELLIVGSDITEKKRAEDELRSKTAFLEAQTQARLDGILVVDEEGKAVLQNKRLFEIPHTRVSRTAFFREFHGWSRSPG